ncbi:MAG: caspase family protein [Bradyrhizobium sp.]|nr:caspase family protein [Bradyrhizobium sp.]
MRICFALLVVSILAVAPVNRTVATDLPADRFALVIGNAKYPDADAPLKEPVNDARDVADELKRDGFNVEIGENLTSDAMRRAFDRLYGKVKPGSVVLIFFSGFGIQAARQSYMIPVDAQIWTEPDVRRDGFSLEAALGEINNRGAGVKIALLDASRRNPFERRFRSFSAGLAPVIAPNNTLVMYSAALGSVISDNGGDHSLFVQELLKEIRVPDLMAEETLNRTRVGVTRASRSEQIPWISSSLADDFAFVPGTALSANPPSPRPTNPAVANAQPGSPQTPQAEPPPVDNKPVETPVAPAVKPEPKSDGHVAASLADDPVIKSLTEKLIQNPNDANALYRRGQVYASKGAYNLAISDFSDSLKLNSKDVEAYNNRCWARTVIGELQAALKDCNEALRLRPSFVDALDSRGLLNLKNGQTKNAIADFDAALKLNPRLTSSLYGRGLAKQRNGAVSEGERDIANAKAMDPNIVQEYASYGIN